MIIGVTLAGCNSLGDVYDDIGITEKPIVGEATYVLTSDDYDDLGLTFGTFGSEDEAKTVLPDFIEDMFPQWGNGSSVLMGYDLYIGNAEGVSDYTDDDDHYYLSEADYALSGSDVLGFYPDVDASDYLTDILDTNITTPEEGQVALARYVQFTETPMVSITTNYNLDDNFDYGATAGDLTAVSGGEWEAHSGAGNGPIGYDTSGLSMTDYPSSDIGGSLTVDGAGSEDVTNWFSEISSGTVYASTLVNLSAVSTGTYTFHLRDNDFAVGYVARVGAMDDGFGKILFGIGASSSSLVYGTTPFDLNTTYLLVSSYNIATGEANLYVLSTAEATEPATPETTDSGNPSAIVSGVSIRQGGGGPTGTFDGIRVATSWDAIMVNDVAELVEGARMITEIFYTYNGGEWDVTDGVYFLQDADYDSMGEGSGQPGRFNNFGSSVPPDDYLPTFLANTNPYTYGQEDDELIVIYDYFSSSSGAGIRGNRYSVIDGSWVGHKSVISTTLQFGHNGTEWVPDNTIRYTLEGGDYSFIGDALLAVYPGPASNVSQFSSFDRREGRSNYWSNEMLAEGFDILLSSIDSSAAEGQKYIMIFNTYIGSVVPEDLSIIKTGGVWVLNE